MFPAGPGAHPLTDLLFHGQHPFPVAVEHLILKIHTANPRAWREFVPAAEGWARLPRSGEACGRVVDYLNRVLQDLDEQELKSH